MNQTAFTIYTSHQAGNAQNVQYPHDHHITSETALKQAVAFDHVVAEYQGGRRSATGFVGSTCVVMDIDNDHTDRQLEWVSPEKLDALLPEVEFYTATSRNHLKSKGSTSARPRFHVYFPIPRTTVTTAYVALKKELAARYEFFDANATDAARFIYGNPHALVQYFAGSTDIGAWLSKRDLFAEFDEASEQIQEGSRNATLSRFAGRVLIRYGNSLEARSLFDRKADRCNPPLPTDEVERIWHSALRFAREVAKNPDYISPEEYAELSGLKPDDYTDVGQATVFATDYLGRVRYSPATDWLVYRDGIWEESDPMAQLMTQQLTTRQLEQAKLELEDARERLDESGATTLLLTMSRAKAQGMFTPEQRRAFQAFEEAEASHKYVLKRRESKAISACMRESRTLLQIDPTELDANPYLLNTPGVTFDLREGVTSGRGNEAADLFTKQTAVTPSGQGAQIWEDALNVFFQNDPELIAYVQRIVGLAAFGYVRVEAMIIAYGDGRNGKSTFWNTLARVLGTYSGNISADVLTIGMRRNVKPELAEAKGKRLLIAAELEEGVRLSTSHVKQLASTDEIYAEKKYKAPFAFTPSHTLVLYTNHLPRVGAMDAGIWRRLIVIPFEAKIEGRADIKNYADYLFENAAGAILTWIIEGAELIHAEGYKLRHPQKVAAAIAAFKDNNDWFSRFIEECCDVDPSLSQPSGQLYEEYRAWAARTGEWARNQSDFYAQIEQAGFTRSRTASARLVHGLALTSEFSA
ncbi:phage/plasmid primase, P4 family [Arcanobacterium canis]